MIVDAYFWWALLKVCCFLGGLGISVWVAYQLMTWNSAMTLIVLGGIIFLGILISAANLTAEVDRAASEAAYD